VRPIHTRALVSSLSRARTSEYDARRRTTAVKVKVDDDDSVVLFLETRSNRKNYLLHTQREKRHKTKRDHHFFTSPSVYKYGIIFL